MSKQVPLYSKNEAKDEFEAKYGAPIAPEAWSIAVGLMRAVFVTLPRKRRMDATEFNMPGIGPMTPVYITLPAERLMTAAELAQHGLEPTIEVYFTPPMQAVYMHQPKGKGKAPAFVSLSAEIIEGAVYVTLPADRKEPSRPVDLYPQGRRDQEQHFAANSIGAKIIHEMLAAGKDVSKIPGEHEANRLLREAVFTQDFALLKDVSTYSKKLFEMHDQSQAWRQIIAGSIAGKSKHSREHQDAIEAVREAEAIDPIADEILRIYRDKNQDEYRTPDTDPAGNYEWHPVPEYRPAISDLIREMKFSADRKTIRKICAQYGLPLDPRAGQRSS